MGYSLELLSLIPGKVSFRTPSESKAKPGSKVGKSIVEHALEFYWIEDGKAPAIAPRAKIIDYFQYPEMRFSGFLSGCVNPPDALRRVTFIPAAEIESPGYMMWFRFQPSWSPYKPEIDNSRSKQAICPQLCPQFHFNRYKLKQGLRISYFSATLVLF